jgi:hypothetical protein
MTLKGTEQKVLEAGTETQMNLSKIMNLEVTGKKWKCRSA